MTKKTTQTLQITDSPDASSSGQKESATRHHPTTGIHAGHRKRLRLRFQSAGLDDFAPHEIMELLLTYCIPRVDVNDRAHALINRFGSLSQTLDAPVRELCSVPGIGEEAALFLSMFPPLFRRYSMDRCAVGDPMDTMAKLEEYLHALYTGVTTERVYLLLFDNAMRLIDCRQIDEGTVNASNASVRKMAEAALFCKAAAAVLVHNHPRGVAVPSAADYDVTDAVAAGLELLGVPLIEHFVVAEYGCSPIRRGRGNLFRSGVGNGHFNEQFYQKFYGEGEEN